MKRSEFFFGLIRIPFDFGMTILAMFVAYYLRSQEAFSPFLKKPDLELFPSLPDFLKLAGAAAVLLLVIFSFLRMYSLRVTVTFSREIRKILAGVAIWFMAVITYYFLLREFPFSRGVFFYSSFFIVLLVMSGRLGIYGLQRMLLARGIGKRSAVFLGNGNVTDELEEHFRKGSIYEVIGRVNTIHELEKLAKERGIDELIQTKILPQAEAEEAINFCRASHIVYHFIPDIVEVSRTNVEVRTIGGIPIISLRPTSLDGWGKVLKRTFDLVASACGLIILSPFFLIIAILIKLDSPGRVFFRYLDDGRTLAKRVGQHGKQFCCLKFRTMKSGTHHLRYSNELLEQNIRKDSPLVKIENDPRITRTGRFLRKYSLDELPQLWNVLKGEMSLVGPRPHLPEEVGLYQHHHKFVLTLKPGITGLAQISGRSDLPFEKEIRLDTYYIENWSLWLDIKILLKTFFVVFRGYRE